MNSKKVFWVKRWKAYLDWAEIADVSINGFDDQGNLFAFDMTADEAITLGSQLITHGFSAKRLTEQYNKDVENGKS